MGDTVTTGSGPTWYDLLGVAEDAEPAEIKAAWRRATDDVDPASGSSRFQSYNTAAAVLLDGERRADYDAALAATRAEQARLAAETPGAPDGPDAPDADEEAATAPAGEGREPGPVVRRLGTLPVWVPLVLGVVAVLVVGFVVHAALTVQARADVERAREQAPVAAEEAAAAILSYDYRQLDEDRARAERFVTGDFEQEFLDNFALLQEQQDGSPGLAVQSEAVVGASVMSSGVIDVDDAGDTVRVLVFVNMTSEREGQDPQIFYNRVAMTMQEDDGRWLVSDVASY